jgi:hypothetical protein
VKVLHFCDGQYGLWSYNCGLLKLGKMPVLCQHFFIKSASFTEIFKLHIYNGNLTNVSINKKKVSLLFNVPILHVGFSLYKPY